MKLVDYEKYYHSESEFIIPRDEFEKIIEENQRLNNDIKILLKENEAKEKVIIKYDNILNELENILNSMIYQGYYDMPKADYEGTTVQSFMATGDNSEFGIRAKFILNKLNELKESDK